MDTLYKILLAAHGLCGLVALVTFWMAASRRRARPGTCAWARPT